MARKRAERTGERVDVRLNRAMRSGRFPAELLICGPAGTGKTYSILRVLHTLARDYPNLRILFVRATRKSLTESVLVTYEQEILPSDGCEHIASGAGRAHRHNYEYPDSGTEIVLAGLDRNEGSVMSTAWDIVFVNESIDLNERVWEAILSRLGRPGRDPRFGWLIGDTNPSYPQHWLKQRCDSGKTELWTTTHEANPGLHDGRDWTPVGRKYLTTKLDKLTGARKLRLRHGIWAAAEGAVYGNFSEPLHVIDPFPIPADWRKFRAIDFGYNDPFVCQWWAIDPWGRLYLYREVFRTRRTVREWAKLIHRLTGRERIEATVTDHDAEDRATLEECGIETVPAFKAIKRGIEAVDDRLLGYSPNGLGGDAGDGKPRLYLFRDCLAEDPDPMLLETKRPHCTAAEVPGYIWSPIAQGRKARELPIDRDNHGLDAMRYAVTYADELGSFSAEVY